MEGALTPSVTDWLQAGAAIMTMFAAFVAAFVAAKAPKLAAEYAESYRRKSAESDEMRAFQIYVFRALMKGRSEIIAQDTRAALNLVEAAFHRSSFGTAYVYEICARRTICN